MSPQIALLMSKYTVLWTQVACQQLDCSYDMEDKLR